MIIEAMVPFACLTAKARSKDVEGRFLRTEINS